MQNKKISALGELAAYSGATTKNYVDTMIRNAVLIN